MKRHSDVDIACLRLKSGINIKNIAIVFKKICKKYDISKILIHSYFSIAKALDFDGIHLSSHSFNILSQAKKSNLYAIISTHNETEIKKALEHKSDAITYSPIFRDKFRTKADGLDNLIKFHNRYSLDIYPLGGISSTKQENILKENGIHNFASISYFFK